MSTIYIYIYIHILCHIFTTYLPQAQVIGLSKPTSRPRCCGSTIYLPPGRAEELLGQFVKEVGAGAPGLRGPAPIGKSPGMMVRIGVPSGKLT